MNIPSRRNIVQSQTFIHSLCQEEKLINLYRNRLKIIQKIIHNEWKETGKIKSVRKDKISAFIKFRVLLSSNIYWYSVGKLTIIPRCYNVDHIGFFYYGPLYGMFIQFHSIALRISSKLFKGIIKGHKFRYKRSFYWRYEINGHNNISIYFKWISVNFLFSTT